MADIYPFPGIRYNQEIVGDLVSVICPPYDVISPEQQRAYYEKSDYNVVRLEHGMELPEDTKTDNKHSRANTTFNQWLKDRILQADVVPSFYIHEHSFTYQKIRRRGLYLMNEDSILPWASPALSLFVKHESSRTSGW